MLKERVFRTSFFHAGYTGEFMQVTLGERNSACNPFSL